MTLTVKKWNTLHFPAACTDLTFSAYWRWRAATMHLRQMHSGETEETDVAFAILIVKIAIRDVSSGVIFDGFSAGCRLVDVRFAPKRDLPDTGKSVCDFSDRASMKARKSFAPKTEFPEEIQCRFGLSSPPRKNILLSANQKS